MATAIDLMVETEETGMLSESERDTRRAKGWTILIIRRQRVTWVRIPARSDQS